MFISAIIPAYNEEKTISDVVNAVKDSEQVDEIIVVSDGSTDRTAEIAEKSGARVVRLNENMGKGAAVMAGLDKCSADLVLFLDADLIGLNTGHIVALLQPVINDEAGMTVGIFSNGRLTTDLAHKISPQLSGQRAVRRAILNDIGDLEETGYGIEIALTAYVEKENIKVTEVELADLTHVMKEEKMGLVKGFGERLKMYWEIYKGSRLVKR